MKKKILSFLLTVVMSVSVFGVYTASAAGVNIAEGVYVFYTKLGNNMVLDVAGGVNTSKANIQIYTANNSNAQLFQVRKVGNYYTINNCGSGLNIDVKGTSKASGANVQQYKKNENNGQKWIFEDAGNGYYYIKSALGNYLDVSGGKNTKGTNVQVYKGNKSDAQKWKLVNMHKSKKEIYDLNSTAFLNDSRWKTGKSWNDDQTPQSDIVKNKKHYGCNAYVWDFAKEVYGKDVTAGKKFTKASDIKTGDILYVTPRHWMVVLERTGNKLNVVHGNWTNDKVCSSTFTLKGSTIGSKTFSYGYHFL